MAPRFSALTLRIEIRPLTGIARTWRPKFLTLAAVYRGGVVIMTNSKKWVLISAITASVLLTGVVCSQSILADVEAGKREKAERYQKLKQEEAAERAKLESMQANTKEEVEKQVQQGLKVKELGLEAGKLQEELHPKDAKVRLEEDLRSVRNIFTTHKYYASMVNDPVYGEQYKKAYEILMMKFEVLEKIERDFKENNKPVEQLQNELDDLLKIKELQ
jgi:flagellar biosynthesis component FlhA